MIQVQIEGEKILLRGMAGAYKLTLKDAQDLGKQLLEAEMKIRTRFAAAVGKHYVGKVENGDWDIFYCTVDGRLWRLRGPSGGNESSYYGPGSHHLWCDDYGYSFQPLHTYESGHL